jgi:importin subunit beta-1
VIGKIAAIEIPAGQWPDLVKILDAHITKQSANAGLRQASLEALGYVCEEVPEHLQAHSNLILTAIASGMAPQETNNDIKLSATVCLVNSIEFIKANMAVPNDRQMIMAMVFSVTKAPAEEQVRVAAYQALVQIADKYYEVNFLAEQMPLYPTIRSLAFCVCLTFCVLFGSALLSVS